MNEFNYDDSAYLAHHGIKGMKWGVRKSRDSYRTGKTSIPIKKRLKSTISNTKSFVKSKRGKKVLATAAGIGAATGATIGALNAYSKAKARKDMQRNGYGSYRETYDTLPWNALPNNNYDQYSPYRKKNHPNNSGRNELMIR